MESEILDRIVEALMPVMPQLRTLGGLIVLDLGLGVAVAIKEKKFEFAEIGRFFQSRVVPNFIGWSVLQVGMKLVVPEFAGEFINDAVVDGVWVLMIADLGGDILNKVAKLGFELVGRIPGINGG